MLVQVIISPVFNKYFTTLEEIIKSNTQNLLIPKQIHGTYLIAHFNVLILNR
jgi:hypothetical protein